MCYLPRPSLRILDLNVDITVVILNLVFFVDTDFRSSFISLKLDFRLLRVFFISVDLD